MLPAAATEFYALQQRVSITARNETRREWRRMGDDFDGSWRRIAPSILSIIAEAQAQLVLAADEYVPKLLGQVDLPDEPRGQLNRPRLIGVASDQRPLDSLAYAAITTAKEAVGTGSGAGAALDQGGDWLDLMTRLQVADAGRQAVGVLMGARTNLKGYVRVLNPPSCSRCAILAGRFYRWSSGFDRHPRCDCVNMPSRDAGWARSEGFLTDPMTAFRNGDIRDLTRAQVKALNEGADISRVVNARRGMSTTARAKRAADARRPGTVGAGQPDLLGMLSKLPRATASSAAEVRLTPEDIYRLAQDDRGMAVDLLRQWGYIT